MNDNLKKQKEGMLAAGTKLTIEEFAAKVAAKLCRHCRQDKPALDTELNRYRHKQSFCNANAVWKALSEE